MNPTVYEEKRYTLETPATGCEGLAFQICAGLKEKAESCDFTLRSARPADAEGLVQMHAQLSTESLFFRYLRPHMPALSELTPICDLSPDRGAAFVAVEHDAAQTIIGLAYYIREMPPKAHTAEFGVVVADRFHGKGLGRAIFEWMCIQARSHGVTRLDAYVHPGNKKMLRLLEKSARPMIASRSAELLVLQTDLEENTNVKPLFSQNSLDPCRIAQEPV